MDTPLAVLQVTKNCDRCNMKIRQNVTELQEQFCCGIDIYFADVFLKNLMNHHVMSKSKRRL